MIDTLLSFVVTDKLQDIHPLLPAIAGAAALLLLAVIAHFIARFGLLRIVMGITRRTTAVWDDALVEHKVFSRSAQVVPALIIYSGIPFVVDLPDVASELLRNTALGYMVLMVMLAISSTLSAAHAVYTSTPVGRERPIKGVVQIIQLGIFILGGVMLVASIMDRSPLIMLSGLGAMGAILILIFKDTILGFVASLQLASQDMVRVGDWIEMKEYGADGDVIDVALHTVKVQNWDMTITMIPTHALIDSSFRNWRGMQTSGGRRIMRSLPLDVNSVRFLTNEEVERYQRFALLKDYMANKRQELEEYNADLLEDTDPDDDGPNVVNLRRLTNIGTFRAYVLNYLRSHPSIHDEMTLMVRQLEPTAQGVPVQVYAFCNDTRWLEFERVQGDLFDHILAIVPEFGLRLYQQPSGFDFQGLRSPAREQNESQPEREPCEDVADERGASEQQR